MAAQNPNPAALGFEIAAQQLQEKALIDAYYYGIVSPQARHARRLEKAESSEEAADKEALFHETYHHDHERYKELASQGFFDLPKKKEELLRKGPSLNFDEEAE
ncbi:MAG: hypothetical protein ACR2N0_10715 [Rubrobacteraceae bacterium]